MDVERWQHFFAMGGYGGYVWGAFALTALGMAAETLALWRRARSRLE